LLAAWAAARSADDLVSLQQFGLAVCNSPFPEAVPALTKFAKDPKANGLNVRAVAVSALARVGDDPARKALTELLADKTPLTSSVPHTIGDQALAGLVNLSKKKPADYQQTKSIHILFKWVACEKPIGLDFYTFVDDDARKAGLRKWKDEATKDKQDKKDR
jgi:hypothetical protein